MSVWPQVIRSSFRLAFCKVPDDQPGKMNPVGRSDGASESLVAELGAIPDEFYYHKGSYHADPGSGPMAYGLISNVTSLEIQVYLCAKIPSLSRRSVFSFLGIC